MRQSTNWCIVSSYCLHLNKSESKICVWGFFFLTFLQNLNMVVFEISTFYWYILFDPCTPLYFCTLHIVCIDPISYEKVWCFWSEILCWDVCTVTPVSHRNTVLKMSRCGWATHPNEAWKNQFQIERGCEICLVTWKRIWWLSSFNVLCLCFIISLHLIPERSWNYLLKWKSTVSLLKPTSATAEPVHQWPVHCSYVLFNVHICSLWFW